MRTNELRYLPGAELRVEPQEGTGKPLIRGYAAVYNVKSVDLGGFREVISPGAFTRSLREGADVRALVDHDSSKILGRNKAGTLKITPNAKGLLVEIVPPETQAARDVMASIQRGDIDGMSFGFRTVTDEWATDDGMPLRTLHDADIFDVSVVTYPAYPQTDVAMRSLAEWRSKTKALEAPPYDPDLDPEFLSLRLRLLGSL